MYTMHGKGSPKSQKTFRGFACGNHEIIDYTEFGLGQINPIRYRSYYYDVETGLYYLHSRYYDPATGRFISMDDINYLDPETIGGTNLYAYCNNNPVMYVDSTGHAFASVLIGLGIAALIGAVIGAGSYVVGQVVDYSITGDFEWSWGGFFGSVIGGAVGGMIAYALPYIGIGSAAVGAFFSAAAATAGMMIGQNITDNAGYSARHIILSSAISGLFAAVSIGVMSRIRIPKFNVGRGSYSAISRQIYTKFRNQTISKITAKTFLKMFSIEAYNGILGSILEDIYDFSGTNNKVSNWL